MDPRSFDQHVALFAAYAGAVAALSSESWNRLTTECAPLEGDSVSAIVRRARLGAKPTNVLESLAVYSRVTRWISVGSTAVVVGIHVAVELLAEFDQSQPSPSRRRSPTTSPSTEETYIDAWFSIQSALESKPPPHPGLAAAVHAAGQAVLRHDWLLPTTFADVYRFVESEIPYQDVERLANGA
jgi:hypothetical protein